MDFLFGADMPLAVRFFFAFVIVLALIGGTAFLVRRFGGERLGASSARGRQPRLAVIDAAAVDGRRRLILIRRDNVEHLLMIGGPSDVVVEANIVRAGANARDARETAAPRPTAAEPAPRSVPMSDTNMWPLAPEPAPAPTPAPATIMRAPPRQQPAMEEPMDWDSEPEAPAPLIPPRRQEPRLEPRAEARSEPRAESRSEPRSEMRIDPRADMRMDVSPDSLPADPLAGLAAELARVQSEPLAKGRPPRDASRDREPPSRERETPREPARARGSDRPPERLRPVPPSPPAAVDEPIASKSADQNLAEMAQRLEAALRRPKPQADQPRGSEGTPSRPAKIAPSSSESMREPESMPMMAEPVAANEDAPPAPQAPTRAAAAKAAPQKSVYDSLEQEMASLLGRPNSKA